MKGHAMTSAVRSAIRRFFPIAGVALTPIVFVMAGAGQTTMPSNSQVDAGFTHSKPMTVYKTM